jgi:hypothetical protein
MTPGSAAAAMPALAMAVEGSVSARAASGRRRHRSRVGGVVRHRTTGWIVAVVVTAAGLTGTVLRVSDDADRIRDLQAALSSARSELALAVQRGEETVALQAEIARLEGRIATLRDARVRTVVEERTVTETVTRWVPNGETVTVEVTGFEGTVELRDVQLTHAYGFSDLIGIAINTSGQTISYAQLGCTFLNADGAVVANAIDNKQNWLPDQTWGFSCSAQVRATGGILRVDEAA